MNRPYLIGLTGSIGMGKSTTSEMFGELGADIWDADAAVHRLYAVDGAAVVPMSNAFPETVVDGMVSRDRIKTLIRGNPDALKVVESIVHPLVRDDRASFIAESTSDVVVCDIPLLFETGGDAEMDATVVVSAPADIQRARVMARPGMTKDLFDAILSKQMPDMEKRACADYVIETTTLDAARAAVTEILTKIRAKHA